TGFFGGMAGCAMIGQSVINVKSGGRGRLSALVAGVFLMFLIIVLGNLVVQIPMPVLVGIMIMVSIGTFDWSSFTYLVKASKSDAAVMVVTVAIVVVTNNLAIGVITGVILSAIFFVAKISKINIDKQTKDREVIYTVQGQLFFASVESFIESSDFNAKEKQIIIDFTEAHIWDDSAVGVIEKVMLKFKESNNHVKIRGLNSTSEKIVKKLAASNA